MLRSLLKRRKRQREKKARVKEMVRTKKMTKRTTSKKRRSKRLSRSKRKEPKKRWSQSTSSTANLSCVACCVLWRCSLQSQPWVLTHYRWSRKLPTRTSSKLFWTYWSLAARESRLWSWRSYKTWSRSRFHSKCSRRPSLLSQRTLRVRHTRYWTRWYLKSNSKNQNSSNSSTTTCSAYATRCGLSQA